MRQLRERVAAADKCGVSAGKGENRDDLPWLDADVEQAQARIVCEETHRPRQRDYDADDDARGQPRQLASARSSDGRLSACDCAH